MKDPREKWSRLVLRLTNGLFVILFLAAAVKAFHLQIFQHEFLAREAERQHQRTVPLTPARGTIYDRNRAELAVSIEMDSCFANPSKIRNLEQVADTLAPLVRLDRATILAKLNSSRTFVWIQRRMQPEIAQKIRELKIPGIDFVKETRRFYPNSETASHLIGFTGLDPVGLEGVEKKYDAQILGSAGYLITERDALGRDIELRGSVVSGGGSGNSIFLTIDRNVQYITERELAKGVIASRGKQGSAIVMEPSTGRILALANYPTFNPNSYRDFPPQNLRNRSISDTYEPGSTLKVLLMASAIEEKVLRPGDYFSCENGSYHIGGKTIHDTHSYGSLSASDILKYSSNIGAAKIGARLGSERLYTYLRNFGLGEKSSIDLPGEAAGMVRDSSQWYGVDLATISFGQGITVTPLQLVTAISAIANGGTLMKPYVVERIVDENGMVVREFTPVARRRVISRATAETVAKMMLGVTTNGGTGAAAAPEGYRVAGKTGTSQKVDPVTRTYSPTRRIASFVGFLPASNPRLTILVVIDEPQTSPYGGVVAAPVFKNIAEQSMRYFHIPPEVTTAEGRPPGGMKQTAEREREMVEPAEVAMAEGGEIRGDGVRMPDFRGLTMRQVLRVMERQGVNVKILGTGRVVQQNPLPGEPISPDAQVWVKLAPSA